MAERCHKARCITVHASFVRINILILMVFNNAKSVSCATSCRERSQHSQGCQICYFCHSEVCAKASPYAFCAISVEGFRSSDESKPTSVRSVILRFLSTTSRVLPTARLINRCLGPSVPTDDEYFMRTKLKDNHGMPYNIVMMDGMQWHRFVNFSLTAPP